MAIAYALEPDLSATEFRDVLVASTLGARRPVDDLVRLERMLFHADIIVTARDGARLVGVSRAISDFAYCCYLSDLAVDVAYQRQGIGKRLIDETRQAAGEGATLILVAAPSAQAYYPKIGMVPIPSGWMIPRTR
ncbi:MAG TPA: GNAT family N-acetyltransferase [Stellaceae bacterium]|jgi:predicted N-acetyltransferase YhbS|nr:GNAT family N-acetyltransferase [Stellaceae bacterium]